MSDMVLRRWTDMSDMVLSPSEVVESSDPDHDNTNYATSQKLYSTRANDNKVSSTGIFRATVR